MILFISYYKSLSFINQSKTCIQHIANMMKYYIHWKFFFFLNAHHVEQITAEKDGFCEIQYACKHAVTLCQKSDIHLVMYNFSFLH